MSSFPENDNAALLMDRMYRYQTHIYDWTRKPYLLGRDRLLVTLSPPEQGTILEIACGTGRNLIRAAQSYPQAYCFGFDIANVMIDKARYEVKRSGLAERIKIAQGDATQFSPEEKFGILQFDRVYISYALSMIPNWYKALQHALSLVKPTGMLFIVDFGDASQQPICLRPLLINWLKLFHVTPQPGLIGSAKQLAQDNSRLLNVDRLWGGYANLLIFSPQK